MLKFYSVGFIEKSDAKELKLSEAFGNLKIHVWLSPREGWQGRSRKSPPEKHILVGHSRVVLSEGTSGQGPRFLAYTETAAVNLQTFSCDSAVTDAQSVWWADGISSEGQISPSSSSCPADESCVYFQEKVIGPAGTYVPAVSATENICARRRQRPAACTWLTESTPVLRN